MQRPPFVNLALCLMMALSPIALLPEAAQARENLGLYGPWGVFRDPLVPRCYAIAMAQPSAMRRTYQPYATIGTWPRRGVRSQVHFRLSRAMAPHSAITLRLGAQHFSLIGGGGDAWPANATDNAGILAAMRSTARMTVSAMDRQGHRFSNTWDLPGISSAMDAALIGCASLS